VVPIATNRREFTALRRLLVIAPMLEVERHSARRKKLPLGGQRAKRASLTSIAEQCASTGGVSIATVWRWYRKARKEGFNALAHERSDIGVSRFFALRPEAVSLVQQLALKSKPRLAVREILRRLEPLLGSDTPNYQTIRRFVNRIRARRGYQN
jgi:hypothetical protein